MSATSLLGLHHRQAIIELERCDPQERSRRFVEVVAAPYLDWDRAIREATEAAELRGRAGRPVKIMMCQEIAGVCRDCRETVFTGGEARVRMNDIRCWGCGGGP